MRLAIPTPSSWPITHRSGRQVAVIPGAEEPDLLLESGRLELLPDDQRRWVQQALRREIPPAARLDITGDETTRTASGWPVRLVEASVLGSDGALLERRLLGVYAFFEHGATAMLRGLSAERFDAHRDQVREMLIAAGPDWSGEIGALSQLWDVTATGEARRPTAPESPAGGALDRAAAEAGAETEKLEAILAEVDLAIESGDDPARLQLLRGRVLRSLGRNDEAIEAFERALEIGGVDSDARYSKGLALVALERTDEAIAAWQTVAGAEPDDVDALYNIGVAHYTRGELESALEAWTAAFERRPEDFWIARKVIQAQRGLERHDEAISTRDRLLAIWRSSPDPAVRLADEYVLDQFDVAGVRVFVSETLRPRDPTAYAIYTFRADSAPPVSVQIETSDYARQRGVPFVISRIARGGYKALGTAERLPPYPELRATAAELIEAALRE